MNIDLKFQDWSLVLEHASVRQFDDRAQTLRVTGDLPAGRTWRMYLSVYAEAYFNAIPLAESDGALTAVLTRDDLAFGDTVYTLQLVGETAEERRHTTPVRLYVGASLSGDGVWPEIPRSFTDAEQNALRAAAAAEAAAAGGGAARTLLDRLATFGAGAGETVEVPDYTNVIPLSVDTDGTVLDGVGYRSGYRLNSSGALVAAEGVGVTGFIPLGSDLYGAVLRFAGMQLATPGHGSQNNSRIAFYNAAFEHVNGGGQTGQALAGWVFDETDEDGYATCIDLSAQTVSYPRKGTAYFRVCAPGLGAASAITINEELTTHTETAPAADGVALKESVYVPLAASNQQRIAALEAAVQGGSGAAETGVLADYAAQIDKARTFGYQPVLSATDPNAAMVTRAPLNFLHISDTHGSANLERAVTVLNTLASEGRCACMVHTGDLHAATFASDYTGVQAALDGAEAPVLLVAGNHDVGNNSQSTADTATDAQLYERVFAPVIDDWDLTNHPDGKCYWYKDFGDAGVRMIGLYDFESDYELDAETGVLVSKRGYAAYRQAQIDWLIDALLTCPADWGVIIAKHNPVNARGTLDSPFNSPYLQGRNTGQTYVDKNIIPAIVQAFMDGTAIDATYTQAQGVVTTLNVSADFSQKNAGAEFVCYLNGHTHADGVSFLQDYPKQLELNIGADNFHYQHYADTLNQQGTRHQDLLNYVSVNRNFGYVYLLRIGNAFSARASRRDFTAIDYRNPPSEADGTRESEDGDLPLVKTITVTEAVSDQLDVLLDAPLKKMRVVIAGAANEDVTAAVTPTVYALAAPSDATSFATRNLKKIAYRPIVNKTATSLVSDWHNNTAMGMSEATTYFGTAALNNNGWLNAAEMCLAPCETWYVAHGIRIAKSGSVVATTGMTISIYGVEA